MASREVRPVHGKTHSHIYRWLSHPSTVAAFIGITASCRGDTVSATATTVWTPHCCYLWPRCVLLPSFFFWALCLKRQHSHTQLSTAHYFQCVIDLSDSCSDYSLYHKSRHRGTPNTLIHTQTGLETSFSIYTWCVWFFLKKTFPYQVEQKEVVSSSSLWKTFIGLFGVGFISGRQMFEALS